MKKNLQLVFKNAISDQSMPLAEFSNLMNFTRMALIWPNSNTKVRLPLSHASRPSFSKNRPCRPIVLSSDFFSKAICYFVWLISSVIYFLTKNILGPAIVFA